MPLVPRGRGGRRHLQLDGAVRRTVLPGGLQVVTEDIRSTNTYSLGVFAAVGSRHETARLHGASHFLEHLLFKGTMSRTAEQISAAIEAVGGELNAYTAKEHTCFYARVLHSDAELALDVLIDMITKSLITSEDVDSVIRVAAARAAPEASLRITILEAFIVPTWLWSRSMETGGATLSKVRSRLL